MGGDPSSEQPAISAADAPHDTLILASYPLSLVVSIFLFFLLSFLLLAAPISLSQNSIELAACHWLISLLATFSDFIGYCTILKRKHTIPQTKAIPLFSG